MTKFNVWITFTSTTCYTVEADTEDEAREIAADNADAYDVENDEWELAIDSVEVTDS